MCWRMKRMTVMPAAVAAAMLVTTAGAYAQIIPPGQDCLETTAGSTWLQFGGSSSIPPIPADFFFPGSLPWVGVINLRGDPMLGYVGAVDTVIERKEPADVSGLGVPATVGVEVKELHLRSREPIIVDGPPGRADSFFDLFVTVDSSIPSQGFMTMIRESPTGGVFSFRGREDGGISLYPRFIFVPVMGGGEPKILDPDPPLLLESVYTEQWQFAVPALTCYTGNQFYPVPGSVIETVLDGGDSGEHDVTPPSPGGRVLPA
jgi:hypothetical protein